MRSVVRWTLPAILICASLAWAQVGTSTITGRVTDPTGAVVPNVSVLVINVGTNFQSSVKTNDEGLFRVQSLQPGPYRVTFEAGGFKRLVRDNLGLRTGDTMAVDAVLEVGSVTDSVEVKTEMRLRVQAEIQVEVKAKEQLEKRWALR